MFTLFFCVVKCCKTSTAGLKSWSYSVCFHSHKYTEQAEQGPWENLRKKKTNRDRNSKETGNQNLTQRDFEVDFSTLSLMELAEISKRTRFAKRCLNAPSRPWNWHLYVKSRQSKLLHAINAYIHSDLHKDFLTFTVDFFLIDHMFSDAPVFFILSLSLSNRTEDCKIVNTDT